MHSCRLAGGWRLALGTTLLLTGMAAGGDRAASGPFPPWPRAKGPIEVGSGAMQPIAPASMVRVTRAPRWSSEDLADFICYGVEDEPLRSLMVWGRSGAIGHPQKGAGVVVNAEAHIITTETLVGCEATAQVQFADGRAVVARVVGRDPLLNVALLEVKAAGGPIPAARLGDAAGLAPGSEVAVPVWDGNDAPRGHMRRGKVLRVGRVPDSGLFAPQIETDIPADEVEVGAPLLDTIGGVVGLIVPPMPSSPRLARAVPMDAVQKVLPHLASLGRVPRGWAGLMVQPATRPLADALGSAIEGQPVVAHVVRGGPAELAGIRPGDIMALFDGVRIRSIEGLAEAIAKAEIGSVLRVYALRGGWLHPFSLRVAETPQSGDWPPRPVGLAELNIHILPTTPGLPHLWDPRLADGLLVTRVAGGGAGEAAGLEPGDLLRVVNGRALRERNAISVVRQALRDHTPALLLVERDGLNRLMAAASHHRASGQRNVTQRPRPPALSRVQNRR